MPGRTKLMVKSPLVFAGAGYHRPRTDLVQRRRTIVRDCFIFLLRQLYLADLNGVGCQIDSDEEHVLLFVPAGLIDEDHVAIEQGLSLIHI